MPGQALWLWRVKTTRWSGNEGKLQEEFVAAETLQQVWDEHLKYDRMDKGVEIEAIVREVPILNVLRVNRSKVEEKK